MEIRVENGVPLYLDEENAPLLASTPVCETVEKTPIQKALTKAFKSAAHLSNLLPTGTVLAFQLLSPIFTNHFTNQGECDMVGRGLTTGLLALCGLSCFLLSFTDTFKDPKGTVYHGIATTKGLWIIDGERRLLPPELEAKYRLRFMDFVHAFMSVLVFAAISFFDHNVLNCFYPTPSDQAKELLTKLPSKIGFICSLLFVAFPTKRHGIGFPLTAN